MGHKKKEKAGWRDKRLMEIPAEKLLYELTLRKGAFELGIGAFSGALILSTYTTKILSGT